MTMNLIADQDRIFQLVENENDSREIPMRDNESEHQEGRKEHTEILDIRKRTRTRQENQTERMLKRRRSELQPGEVSDSVTIATTSGTRRCKEQYWCHHSESQKMTSTGLELNRVCCEVASLAISLKCVKKDSLTCVILINPRCCRTERLFQ